MITTTHKTLSVSLKTLAISMALLGASTGTAHAISTTISGTNVDFTYDSSLTGLFGSPAVSGNILYFTPILFKAVSSNGTSISTSQNLSLTITPHAGFVFDSLSYISNGDYSLFGTGTNTVNVGGTLNLTSGANNFNSSISAGALTTISPSLLSTTNWNAPVNASLTGWGSNPLNASLLSTLSASSGTFAFIEQKYVGFNIIMAATPVPEVETWTMMLAGVGLIALQLRRRTSSEARAIG